MDCGRNRRQTTAQTQHDADTGPREPELSKSQSRASQQPKLPFIFQKAVRSRDLGGSLVGGVRLVFESVRVWSLYGIRIGIGIEEIGDMVEVFAAARCDISAGCLSVRLSAGMDWDVMQFLEAIRQIGSAGGPVDRDN